MAVIPLLKRILGRPQQDEDPVARGRRAIRELRSGSATPSVWFAIGRATGETWAAWTEEAEEGVTAAADYGPSRRAGVRNPAVAAPSLVWSACRGAPSAAVGTLRPVDASPLVLPPAATCRCSLACRQDPPTA